MKVLLTGPSGRVGPHLVEPFRADFDLKTFDLPGQNADFEGDLSEIEPLRLAMRGVDVVVHLAATSDDAPFVEQLVPNNVIGLYNVFEAARLEGVRRVVWASSVQAVGRNHKDPQTSVSPEDTPHPRNLYGVTKVWGEALGRFYHDKHGMEFIGIRIGAFQTYDSPWFKTGLCEQIWLSPRDCAQIFQLAIETPSIGYLVVNATSRTSHAFLSLESARDVLGYDPQDDSRDFYLPETFGKQSWPQKLQETQKRDS